MPLLVGQDVGARRTLKVVSEKRWSPREGRDRAWSQAVQGEGRILALNSDSLGTHLLGPLLRFSVPQFSYL